MTVALLRWDPWGEVMALQQEVNQLFNRSVGANRAGTLVPPIDAFRTEEALVVRMELPGLSPDEVDISVQDGVLTVSGERAMPADVPQDAWVRRERPAGAFERSFTLPEGTDADTITASFDHGLLELHIPHPPERQPRRITVSAGRQHQAVEAGDEGPGS